ncbi:MAG TPA: hypothetical protein VFG54_11945 [Prolixibacteraceae bacterium]|nr:hypothetical protein [Prolixibacteraceae bacterium]
MATIKRGRDDCTLSGYYPRRMATIQRGLDDCLPKKTHSQSLSHGSLIPCPPRYGLRMAGGV